MSCVVGVYRDIISTRFCVLIHRFSQSSDRGALLAFLSDLRSSSYDLLRIVCALYDHVAKRVTE